MLGAAIISFMFCKLPLSGAVIYFSLSITLIFTAQYLSLLGYKGLIKFGRLESKFRDRIWTVLFSFCLVGAPAVLVGMLAGGMLTRNYAFVVAIMPLEARLISRLNLSDGGNLALREAFIETSGISLLFVVIITIVKLIT